MNNEVKEILTPGTMVSFKEARMLGKVSHSLNMKDKIIEGINHVMIKNKQRAAKEIVFNHIN